MATVDYNTIRVSNENISKHIPLKSFLVNPIDLSIPYEDPFKHRLPWFEPESNGLVMYRTSVDQDALISTVLLGDLHPIDVHFMMDPFSGDTARESKIILRKIPSNHQYLIFTSTKTYLFDGKSSELKIPATSTIMVMTVPTIYLKLDNPATPDAEGHPNRPIVSISDSNRMSLTSGYNSINIRRATIDPLVNDDPMEIGPLLNLAVDTMAEGKYYTGYPIFMLAAKADGTIVFPVYKSTPITNYRTSSIVETVYYDIAGNLLDSSSVDRIYTIHYNRDHAFTSMEAGMTVCENWTTVQEFNDAPFNINASYNPINFLTDKDGIPGLMVPAKIETYPIPDSIGGFMTSMNYPLDFIDHIKMIYPSNMRSKPGIIEEYQDGEVPARRAYVYSSLPSKTKYPTLKYDDTADSTTYPFGPSAPEGYTEKHLLPSSEVGYEFKPVTIQHQINGRWKTSYMDYVTAPPKFVHPYEPVYYAKWKEDTQDGPRYLYDITEDTDESLSSNVEYVKLKRMEFGFTGSRPYIYDDEGIAYQLAPEFKKMLEYGMLVFKNGKLVTNKDAKNFFISRISLVVYQGTYIYMDQKMDDSDEFYFVFDPNYRVTTLNFYPEEQPHTQKGIFYLNSYFNYTNAVFYINGVRMSVGDGLVKMSTTRRYGPGLVHMNPNIGLTNNIMIDSIVSITPRSVYATRLDEYYSDIRNSQKNLSPSDFDVSVISDLTDGYESPTPDYGSLVANPSALAKYCILFEIILKILPNPQKIEKADLPTYLSQLKGLFPELTIKTLYENLFPSDRIVIAGDNDGQHKAKFLIK